MFIATITGYLGNDPEIRQTNDKKDFATFSVGIKGIGDENTTWVSCSCFGSASDYVSKYLKKGHLVTLVGDMRLKQYQTKDGYLDKSLNMIVSRIEGNTRESGENGTTTGSSKGRRPANKG